MSPKTATLYRMATDGQVCPHGLKSKHLLESQGYTVEDHHLATRSETEAFKAQHDVQTTPQTFIGSTRIGGHDDLRAYFGKSTAKENAASYTPVIAIFAVAALLALSLSWSLTGAPLTMRAGELFIAISMCLLAVQKLQDVRSFATMFLGYDLLARRWVPYATIYPFGEALAGILMAGRLLDVLSIPIALFIGTIGAVSVFYAVYVQKRDLKCACVGGDSSVPLGFVSLTENVMMVLMALWMLLGR